MSGTPKRGISFSGWDVTIFDGDKKIDKLLDAQGWRGFGVYFYLCQQAYKLNGYFLEWRYDDSATTARRMGGGVGAETVSQAVDLCLQIGLFDNRLFDRDGILTSRGIQRRFLAATEKRRAVHLEQKYWLLEPDETKSLNKVARFDYLLPANDDLLPANDDLLPANDPKRNKNKLNKTKEKKAPTRRELEKLKERVEAMKNG